MRFFWTLDDETDCIVGIVSRNLATQSNFVGFRDKRNFTYFEATGVGRHMVSQVVDSWQAMCHIAWQRPMHVGHMASHVCCTWLAMCVTHGMPRVIMHDPFETLTGMMKRFGDKVKSNEWVTHGMMTHGM